METNLPSCFSIQFLEQLLKFLVNFNLLKYVKSQRSYGFLNTKELIFGFQILDLKDHFSASLIIYLKVRSHDPILVQLSFQIFFVYDEKCWRSHNPIFPSNYFVMHSEKHNNSCYENLCPFHRS